MYVCILVTVTFQITQTIQAHVLEAGFRHANGQDMSHEMQEC